MTLDAIRRRDPAFDQTRFLSRAEAVLALVLRARAEGRPDQARAVVSDDMAMRLRAEADGQPDTGRRLVQEGLRVRASPSSRRPLTTGGTRSPVNDLAAAATAVQAEASRPLNGQRHPPLLKTSRGLTWYIPVQSESRSSTRKTYRAAPGGSRRAVF